MTDKTPKPASETVNKSPAKSGGISFGAIAVFILFFSALIGGQYYLSSTSWFTSSPSSKIEPQRVVVFDDIAALRYFVDTAIKIEGKTDFEGEVKKFELSVQKNLDAFAAQNNVTIVTARVAISGGTDITRQVVEPLTAQILGVAK